MKKETNFSFSLKNPISKIPIQATFTKFDILSDVSRSMVFHISLPNKNVALSASSESERDDWIDAIKVFSLSLSLLPSLSLPLFPSPLSLPSFLSLPLSYFLSPSPFLILPFCFSFSLPFSLSLFSPSIPSRSSLTFLSLNIRTAFTSKLFSISDPKTSHSFHLRQSNLPK